MGVSASRVDGQARSRRGGSPGRRGVGAGALRERKGSTVFPLKRLRETVARFASRNVVVVGDLIADEYLYGESTRQQVVRLDREPEPAITDPVEAALVAAVKTAASSADAFLVSDYGYGAVTPRVFETVLEAARSRRAVVTVDSRYDLPRFKG